MIKFKQHPKPKRYDFVEKVNLSKMFGTVGKIVDKNRVKVTWHDKIKPYTQIESIKTLALVSRRRR
jgi:uncharacterized protein YabE (DUF348 family)